MASDQREMTEPSFIERLINSRNRNLSLLLPIIFGFTNNPIITDPDQDSSERTEPRDRIIIINPLTQGMVVIEGSSSGVDSLLRDLLSKNGEPPASKASIEALPSVETNDGDECVICLEEWENRIGELAKEMPCNHKFHGECIEKWLKIHGSCPVCRYKMPLDVDQDFNHKSVLGSEERGRRREFWISLSLNNSDRRSGVSNQTASDDFQSASAGPDYEM